MRAFAFNADAGIEAQVHHANFNEGPAPFTADD
jgi:hypothetical protein